MANKMACKQRYCHTYWECFRWIIDCSYDLDEVLRLKNITRAAMLR